jgi:hypothetical protein
MKMPTRRGEHVRHGESRPGSARTRMRVIVKGRQGADAEQAPCQNHNVRISTTSEIAPVTDVDGSDGRPSPQAHETPTDDMPPISKIQTIARGDFA